jgi:PleD family two-component response regulator
MALPATDARIAPQPDDEVLVEAIYIGGDGGLADLYRLKLEMDGYLVRLASTGTEGLAQARKRIPDIVFIDLGPADESLLQTHRRLRRDRELKDIPAVLLWRGDTDPLTIESLGLGARDFLVRANGSHSEPAWLDVTSGRMPFSFAP